MTTQPNTTCTCPTGDGSLRWPCPVHTPAAAQEAVAWAVYGKSDEWPEPVMLADYVGSMEVIRKRVMEGAIREGFKGDFVERMAELGWWLEPLVLAAPVTAAPADARSLALEVEKALGWRDGERDAELDSLLETAMGILDSTPAAPGIDLEQFRQPVTFWLERLVTQPCTEAHAARLREANRLLALIDASPKGALNEQFGSAEGFPVSLLVRDCCEADEAAPDQPDTICISVDQLTEIAQRHAAAASPRGGSDWEATDADIAAWQQRHDLVGAFGSKTDARAAFEDARSAESAAGDAEVQP